MMLQFFKKSGRGINNGNEKSPTTTQHKSLFAETLLDENLIENEEDKIIESRSRLSMNLTEILSDKNCLSYFVQFLETKNALSLIKFYLDAECFKTATEKVYRSTTTTNPTSNNENKMKNSVDSPSTAAAAAICNIRIRKKSTKSTSSDCSDKMSFNSSFDISTSDLLSIDSKDNDSIIVVTTSTEEATTTTTTTSTTATVAAAAAAGTANSDDHIAENFNKFNSVEFPEKIIINNDNCNNNSSDDYYNDDVVDNATTVPDLKTICNLSIQKSLTDDEKSLIYNQTTTPLTTYNKDDDDDDDRDETSNEQFILNNKNSKSATPTLTTTTVTTTTTTNTISENDIDKMKFENQTDEKLKIKSIISADAIRIYRKYFMKNSIHFITDIPDMIYSSISFELCAQQHVDDNGSSRNVSSKLISSKCFQQAQNYIFQLLEMNYLNEFLDSSYYCKYTLDILTNIKQLKLSDILHNESALFYFMEYLEQENLRNLLEFWMAAMNYRKQHYYCCINSTTRPLLLNNDIDDANYDNHKIDSNNLNKNEAQHDAMILYEKYFSLQAPNPLSISDKIRSHVEECICSCDDDHDDDNNDNNNNDNNNNSIGRCFDLPLKIIEKYIENYHFNNFLSCQLFQNYLKELKSKIFDQNTDKLNQRKCSIDKRYNMNRHRKTLSDSSNSWNAAVVFMNGSSSSTISSCSSSIANYNDGDFLSQHNTLLAMPDNLNYNNTKLKKSNTDMLIDSRQLTDPDLLWQRYNTRGQTSNRNVRLAFGRVNSLGRYERDFDLCSSTQRDDDKWSIASGSNKIKNAVRKFVNLPEDKVQEEIAWQVAEMIVKDITSITLATSDKEISE